MRVEVVDLFCGIGGLSAGFKDEGFDIAAGVDSDSSCRYAFEQNVGGTFVEADLATMNGADVGRLFSKRATRILVGCAPCQPFSAYAGRYRRRDVGHEPDSRWGLLEDFGRVIEDVEPEVVSMENVPLLVYDPIFELFVTRLRRLGYEVTSHKVRAERYGVPQQRVRLVVFASRRGAVTMAAETHADRLVSVREAIGFLPPIAAGERHADDRLHVARRLSDVNLRRIRATPPGGRWRDWDDDLKLECHKRDTGKSFRSVYGRMRWDGSSPVITTQCLGIGNGSFGHPEQDRAISIREAALLQTFPPDYRFLPPEEAVNGVRLSRQIGNAVPVLLGRAIARSIRRHLDEHGPQTGRLQTSSGRSTRLKY